MPANLEIQCSETSCTARQSWSLEANADGIANTLSIASEEGWTLASDLQGSLCPVHTSGNLEPITYAASRALTKPTATRVATDLSIVLQRCTDVIDRARTIQQVGYTIYDTVKAMPALIPYIADGSRYSEIESVGKILTAIIKHHQETFKATHRPTVEE